MTHVPIVAYTVCLFLFSQFLQQFRHYEATVQIFQLRPTENNETLTKLVMFLAQVSMLFY